MTVTPSIVTLLARKVIARLAFETMTVSAPRAPFPSMPLIGAEDGDGLVDVESLVVGAGGDVDRVAARGGRADGLLDGLEGGAL